MNCDMLDAYRELPWFARTKEFRARDVCPAFSGLAGNLAAGFFEPMLRRLPAKPKSWLDETKSP